MKWKLFFIRIDQFICIPGLPGVYLSIHLKYLDIRSLFEKIANES